MRRSSFTGVSAGGGPGGEPLIVVEESGGIAEEDEEDNCSKASSPGEAAAINQYLLTPYRDLRKRSLPTPPCTSGITASQVRRLSERGGEGSGPSPIEQAFLATLSQAPAPQPGARRHSVVTICRAPPPSTIFGRNRRESIAAFTPGLPGLLRRDSATFSSRGSLSGQGSNPGSTFNLQLDIMDDIMEAKARAKEKRKTSWAPSTSKDSANDDSPTSSSGNNNNNINNNNNNNYNGKNSGKRRASDLPTLNFNKSGIVCTNTDLINLTSSAAEVGAGVEKAETPNIIVNPNTGSPTVKTTVAVDKKKKLLKDRSNSLDVKPSTPGSSNWFNKRHQPISVKNEQPKDTVVTFTDDKPQTSLAENQQEEQKKQPTTVDHARVAWDKNAMVDPKVIGSAIEVFLNRRHSAADNSSKNGTENGAETAEPAATLCSTIKDLFVK